MKYSEHEKLKAIQKQSQLIHEFFLEFCDSKRIFLAEYDKRDRMFPVGSTTKLIAEFFDIDEDKLEKEKLAMIEEMRNA